MCELMNCCPINKECLSKKGDWNDPNEPDWLKWVIPCPHIENGFYLIVDEINEVLNG